MEKTGWAVLAQPPLIPSISVASSPETRRHFHDIFEHFWRNLFLSHSATMQTILSYSKSTDDVDDDDQDNGLNDGYYF